MPLKSSSIFVFPNTRTFDPQMELAIFILLLRVTKFSPLMKNLFILHWESKSMLLRMLFTLHLCYPRKYAKPLSRGALEGIFQRLFYFSVCLLSNVCLSPLIIYSISASYVLFSASMLIFIFVVWALLSLSYIFTFLLVHYTELRLRLVYQFTSYCKHLSLVQTLSLTN